MPSLRSLVSEALALLEGVVQRKDYGAHYDTLRHKPNTHPSDLHDAARRARISHLLAAQSSSDPEDRLWHSNQATHYKKLQQQHQKEARTALPRPRPERKGTKRWQIRQHRKLRKKRRRLTMKHWYKQHKERARQERLRGSGEITIR